MIRLQQCQRTGIRAAHISPEPRPALWRQDSPRRHIYLGTILLSAVFLGAVFLSTPPQV